MRIRYKPWARPELAAWRYNIASPGEMRGKWAEEFGNAHPLWVELGCGKGWFFAELGPKNPDVNFVEIDIKSEMLVLAKRRAEQTYAEDGREPENLRVFSWQIERLDEVFAPEDNVQRIYVNFCNPWPRHSQQKHRLTHTRQLLTYRKLLSPGGLLIFKTDDDGLFNDTLTKYLPEAGFTILASSRDLLAEPEPPLGLASPPTEHEAKFSQLGIKIKWLASRLLFS